MDKLIENLIKDLEVREAEPIDLDQIVDLENECSPTPWSRESIRKDLEENDKAIYFVAEVNGVILGYMSLWVALDEAQIMNVNVSSRYRRLGIGKKLMTAMLDKTDKMGIVYYSLEVRKNNTAAIWLYDDMGFSVGGVREGYYKDNNEDALLMWRSLE